MNRRSIVAFVATLALSVPAALAQEPSSYEGTVEDARTPLEFRIAEIPDPPESKTQAGQLKALVKSLAALDKALAKPSPVGFVKAAAKADKTLAKAFPSDEGIGFLRSTVRNEMALSAKNDAADLGADLEALPSSPDRDALAAVVAALWEEADDLLGLDEEDFYPALTSVVARLQAARKKFPKLIVAIVGKPGMSAVVDGGEFKSILTTGVMLVDAGQVTYMVVQGVAEGENGTHKMRLTFTGESASPNMPGTFTIEAGGFLGAYTEGMLRNLEKEIYGVTGTVTLLSVDPVAGSASGTFSFTGADGVGVIAEGRFYVVGMEIQAPAP